MSARFGAPVLLVTILVLGCHRSTPPRPNEAAPPGQVAEVAPPIVDAGPVAPPPTAATVATLLENLPDELWLDFEINVDHGCSRSHVSRGVNGRMSLEFLRDRRVRMALVMRENRVFGPSRGAFSRGERDFTHTRKALTRVFRGYLERQGDELRITFAEIDNAAAEVVGHGELQLPVPTTVPARAGVVCREGSVESYDPVATAETFSVTEGQTSSPTTVLLCRFEEQLFDLEGEITVEGAYPLAPEPGLVAGATSFFRRSSVVYRRARRLGEGDQGTARGP